MISEFEQRRTKHVIIQMPRSAALGARAPMFLRLQTLLPRKSRSMGELSVFAELNHSVVASRIFIGAGIETRFIGFDLCNPHQIATFWALGKFDFSSFSRNRFGFAHVKPLPGVNMRRQSARAKVAGIHQGCIDLAQKQPRVVVTTEIAFMDSERWRQKTLCF